MNEGKWISPGGKVEAGETPDECVAREVLEETGLKLKSWVFHGVIEFSGMQRGRACMGASRKDAGSSDVGRGQSFPDGAAQGRERDKHETAV